MPNAAFMSKGRLIHPDFLGNPQILHIELGAGCGDFGQKFYPECFLTDLKNSNDLRSACGRHYCTISCDAHAIPSGDNRFAKIIICNPYGYGFRDKKDSSRLLTELSRVSKDEAEIIIITTGSNTYSAPKRVESRITEFNAATNSASFSYESQEMDTANAYNGYHFRDCDGRVTVPKFKIILQCKK